MPGTHSGLFRKAPGRAMPPAIVLVTSPPRPTAPENSNTAAICVLKAVVKGHCRLVAEDGDRYGRWHAMHNGCSIFS